ncbi:arginine--tRNA ligase [Candidatus Curtissbacteria bacterium RIFCSPLOWO2_02_41_11]|uniref:Arginine--tRNA ligase n=2 Tax=Candidatus Curtissiibacteriota TaxID=1752717 RepID=A0A1F5HU00_9BACT|nr:MAG: arginine--tRNA ligase [Candidatus Curtissbacteria bacterium RIFCSPLOWO2_02_41_11]
MMLREQIKKDIAKAISNFKFPISNAEIEVTRTSDPEFGDFATNLPLKISRGSKQSPMESARLLADSLKDLPYVEKLEVKEPGFINFFLKNEVWQKQVEDVLNRGSKYGANEIAKGQKARVEFVSANPTGPLHFGNARGGPIGDSLASVLEFCGYQVLREYIDNDRGNQVCDLGKTLAARAGFIKVNKADLVYQGAYTKEIAQKIKPKIGRITNLSERQIIQKAGEVGVAILFKEIIADIADMGIKYDLVVHESDLQKEAAKVLSGLEKKGLLVKKEGAVWFAPRNEFLKDKDAVVIKSDGSYTYFTADVVYHQQKFASGYNLVVDIFGSNTVGHVPKLKSLAQALGFDLSKFKVILYQFVRIKRGNEVVKMSKRAGNFVTVREVLDEVGRDATRFFILMHDANSHIDFDLDLARKKSKENPVYYVQYANARICSILTKAKRQTTNAKIDYPLPTTHYQLLTTNYELDLIKQITRLPELVEDIGQSFAVHRLTTYAIELADSFHKFYENCQVLGTGGDLESARLSLILATKIALFNTLKLLGVSAPEKM